MSNSLQKVNAMDPSLSFSSSKYRCIFNSVKETDLKGGIRDVYKGLFTNPADTDYREICLVKKFKIKKFNKHREWSRDVDASIKALEYANDFNVAVKNCNDPRKKQITYLIPEITRLDHIIPCLSDYAIIERYIEGHYKKYSNNNGELKGEQNSFLLAFSHWTYEISEKNHLVCDIQGVEKEKEFILTDPAIHSINGKYGVTDLQNTGMKLYLATHTCNDICTFLKLPRLMNSSEKRKENQTRLSIELSRKEKVFNAEKRKLKNASNLPRISEDSE